jgi:hypothetical protein
VSRTKMNPSATHTNRMATAISTVGR